MKEAVTTSKKFVELPICTSFCIYGDEELVKINEIKTPNQIFNAVCVSSSKHFRSPFNREQPLFIKGTAHHIFDGTHVAIMETSNE